MPSSARQLPLDLPFREAFGREDFLISPCNEEAAKWIDLWPDWPAPALIIYGPEASGKTHLSYVWQESSDALRLPAEDLATLNAGKIFEKNNTLILENINTVIGEQQAESSIFHLYNIAKEQNGSLLLTADCPPQEWGFSVKDLRSRLMAAPAAAIQKPDDELLTVILVKLFQDRQLELSSDVLSYIIPRMKRSFSFARQLVDLADKYALSEKKSITIPLIRKILDDLTADA